MIGESNFFQTFPAKPKEEPHLSPAERVRNHVESIPRDARKTVDSLIEVLSYRLGGNLPDHMVSDARAILREALDAHGSVAVWDSLIMSGANLGGVVDHAAYGDVLNMAEHQYSHAEEIEDSERGYTMEIPFSFGLVEPAYAEALKHVRGELGGKPVLNTLLLGAMAHQGANEFGKFSHQLNERAYPIALDIETEELERVDENLVTPMKADATSLPFADGSQDLVFTNFLGGFLTKDSINSGKKNIAMITEAYRVLQAGGRLIMAERTPSYVKTNSHSWVAKLLLEATMAEIGFNVEDVPAIELYTNHAEKLKGLGNGATELETLEDPHGNPWHFSYMEVGKK